MPIRAFLFDFDGLILDTETASRAGWAWLYEQHGHELPEERWREIVGGSASGWSPMAHLEELVGEPLERETLNERRYAHELTLLEAEELRPGIADYLAAAQERDLKRAIVSSSSRRWIDMHLERLERAVGWDAIITADRDPERSKPRPTAGRAPSPPSSRSMRAMRGRRSTCSGFRCPAPLHRSTRAGTSPPSSSWPGPTTGSRKTCRRSSRRRVDSPRTAPSPRR